MDSLVSLTAKALKEKQEQGRHYSALSSEERKVLGWPVGVRPIRQSGSNGQAHSFEQIVEGGKVLFLYRNIFGFDFSTSSPITVSDSDWLEKGDSSMYRGWALVGNTFVRPLTMKTPVEYIDTVIDSLEELKENGLIHPSNEIIVTPYRHDPDYYTVWNTSDYVTPVASLGNVLYKLSYGKQQNNGRAELERYKEEFSKILGYVMDFMIKADRRFPDVHGENVGHSDNKIYFLDQHGFYRPGKRDEVPMGKKITDCIFDVMTMSREAYMDREKIAPGSSDEMVLRHIAKSIIRNLGREKARGFRVQRVGLHTGSVIPKVENHIKQLLK